MARLKYSDLQDDEGWAVDETYMEFEQQKKLPNGDRLILNKDHLIKICQVGQKFLNQDDIVLKLQGPICVIGDIHAQYIYLWKFLQKGGDPENTKYLFLGDYVDRGVNSIEVMTMLLCLKIMYPDNIYLIRGNHETEKMTKSYGFYEECIESYDEEVYNAFLDLFDYLPLAAVIGEKLLCVHGGISPHLEKVEQLEEFERPLKIPDSGLLSDILWADPVKETGGFGTNPKRGGSLTFDPVVTKKFLRDNGLKGIIRAHEWVMEGYEAPFDGVVTLFSSPNYCDQMRNKGAMAVLDENLNFTFHVVEPSFFQI
ncbi:Serine/threonine-protein phosphatase PP1 isozyme 2 [Tritrichomonas foetus]|uniref:Serine/threonine-protein phosphatase n=1 Tax=Tritrichomonas foetus TaxID=1144522 RepID=A0A1J4KNI3_9EUKA|nr:Serine/threonine-protein phosphatase PP1 isozyme 2 [Tritrichomonas foetus]|eukprot:OHT11262.1 Serine/threonine-protein phosphatase PP1 isozyme 2 [Tritrichomonas foetus]